MSNKSENKFFPSLRRAWIARHARRFKTVSRGDVCKAFGISKAQASADFSTLKRLFPDLLEYDLAAKTYKFKSGAQMPQIPFPVGTFAVTFIHVPTDSHKLAK